VDDDVGVDVLPFPSTTPHFTLAESLATDKGLGEIILYSLQPISFQFWTIPTTWQWLLAFDGNSRPWVDVWRWGLRRAAVEASIQRDTHSPRKQWQRSCSDQASNPSQDQARKEQMILRDFEVVSFARVQGDAVVLDDDVRGMKEVCRTMM
jgi:hypothetical protein